MSSTSGRKQPKKRRTRRNPHPQSNPFRTAMQEGIAGAKGDIATAIGQSIRSTLTNVATGLVDRSLQRLTQPLTGGMLESPQEIAGIGGTTKWPGYIERLIGGEYGVVLIIGARDSGKTTIAVSIAEERQRKLQQGIYFVNYPQQLAPPHITAVHADQIEPLLSKAEYGSTIIIDDASLLINSKRTMTNKGIAFESLVNTVAHRGILLVVTVQDTSDVNKAGLRADAYLIKPPRAYVPGDGAAQDAYYLAVRHQCFQYHPAV